jgi:hypothetical protein
VLPHRLGGSIARDEPDGDHDARDDDHRNHPDDRLEDGVHLRQADLVMTRLPM